MKKLTKFLSLDFKSKVRILRSLILITFFYILVNFLPFNIFKKIYKFLLTVPIVSELEINKTEKIVKDIKMASSILPNHFVCLPQALVFKYLYRNVPNMYLKIGVKKEGVTILSHAWVQYQNDFLIGDLPGFDYLPIWEL